MFLFNNTTVEKGAIGACFNLFSFWRQLLALKEAEEEEENNPKNLSSRVKQKSKFDWSKTKLNYSYLERDVVLREMADTHSRFNFSICISPKSAAR